MGDEKICIGVKTGFNKGFIINLEDKDLIEEVEISTNKIIKPYLRGKNIKRWQADFDDTFLIQIESSENKTHTWSNLKSDLAEKKFKSTHPAIYDYMSPYRMNLINRSDQGRFFWEMRSCSYWNKFSSPKIIWPDIALTPQFCWDESGSVVDMTAFILQYFGQK